MYGVKLSIEKNSSEFNINSDQSINQINPNLTKEIRYR